MKRTFTRILAALPVLLGFALLSVSVHAQEEGNTFVYVNNNNPGTNTVTAFAVLPGGTLNPIGTFPTGGTGTGFGFFATHKITTAKVRRNFLYVANIGSSNISAFKISTDTGGLTPVPGSPFPSGGLNVASLAATPNGRYLYAASFGSSNISAFAIASNGALVNSDSVAMFKIASNGTLMSVPGSPFSAGGFGGAADVEISCKSNLLFDPKFGGGTTVAVFNIAFNGALAAIAGSPFTFAPGSNSNVGVLTPDGRHLEVSNQASNTITVLDVASGGSLTQETDSPSGASPFANPGGFVPQSEGTNREGDLLYVSNGNGVVTGFHIDSDGGLSPVIGSPFPTSGTGFEPSLTVFPAHENEGEGDEVDDSGHKGHFDFEADHECQDSGEMNFEDDGGHKMNGKVSAVAVNGNTAVISGPGTLADGTPVQYTAIVTGNQPVIGANLFSISWITATGSVFQTSGALIDGYIAVHP